MNDLKLGTGQIVTASFEDGDGFTDQNCIDNECGCECHDERPLDEGVYVTIRLDDPDARVGLARVRIEIEDVDQ